MFPTRLLHLAYVPLKSSPKSFFRSHGRSSTRVAELLPGVVEISLHKGILNRFRTFCSSKVVLAISDLSLQKCVPCNKKDLSPMTEGNANALKPKVPEWELLNDGGVMKLRRKWKVKNFLQGLEFFKTVGDLAEAEDMVAFRPSFVMMTRLMGPSPIVMIFLTNMMSWLRPSSRSSSCRMEQCDNRDMDACLWLSSSKLCYLGEHGDGKT
ncbi:Transcriptional coactivator/pterin dehydratase [Cynara cardunculus var. scolymus]|uniref:4a-hydroxytetrahydrobiopterin dehydratase n=1 Tax=Cynara cardunculus var. scolymus TaxID=59895 RepID=A0A103Y1E5_CYNCS|nr:Transcriptional coactivator/pterin dehydratase [Cynara cardunculus var. scolymus]